MKNYPACRELSPFHSFPSSILHCQRTPTLSIAFSTWVILSSEKMQNRRTGFNHAIPMTIFATNSLLFRVKWSIFRQTAKFGQPPCLFHSSVIGIKTKLTKQKVKILMRQLIRSHLIWISTVCKCVSEFT